MPIEIKKGQIQMAIEASKAMVDLSKMAIQGSFLLNGAGAVAIVTAKEEKFYIAGILFACGAIIAVLNGAIAYLTQWKIYDFWYQGVIGNFSHQSKESNWVRAGRASCVVLFVVSLAFFVAGLFLVKQYVYP